MKSKQLKVQRSFRFKRFENKNYSAYNSMHKVVSIGVLSLSILALSKAGNCQNDNNKTVVERNAQERTLEEVVVSDSLLLPVNQTGQTLVVITKQDIEASHSRSVDELLSGLSSVDVQTRGTHGVQSDVSLRGGNFDQTAILVDGINITSSHTGHYSMDLPINLSDIERIEVLKGPASIVYGASALSGGVNIITKKSTYNSFNHSSEVGMYGFVNSETSLSRRIGRTDNRLSFSYKSSDGYTENSAYEMYKVNYGNRVYLGKDNIIDLSFGYNYKDFDANTFYSAKYPTQHEKTSTVLAMAKARVSLVGKSLLFFPSLYYELHKDDYELIEGSETGHNHHNNTNIGLNLDFKYTAGMWSLNFGGDLRYEDIISNVLGEPMNVRHGDWFTNYKQRVNYSGFVQGEYTNHGFSAALGLLSFNNTMIEQDFNLYPSLNLSYRFSSHWDIYSCLAGASRLPTFTELYYSDAIHKANPDLRQEKTFSAEAGVKYRQRFVLAEVSVYYTRGKNLIDWMMNTEDDQKWVCKNINELDKYGVDVTSKIILDEIFPLLRKGTRLSLSYSYLKTDKAKNDYISQYVFNYLKHKLCAELKIALPYGAEVDLRGKYCVREGDYVAYNSASEAKSVGYDPYFVAELNLGVDLQKGVHLYLSATNLFNADYIDIGNIAQPGRWIIGGVKVAL